MENLLRVMKQNKINKNKQLVAIKNYKGHQTFQQMHSLNFKGNAIVTSVNLIGYQNYQKEYKI